MDFSRTRRSAQLLRAFTPVFAGYAERCAAEPGSFRTPASGTVPSLQRITEEVLRRARDTEAAPQIFRPPSNNRVSSARTASARSGRASA